MPVYDYRCSECSKVYDVYHKSREVIEDVVCPSCGSAHHKKLMSIPVVSKGSTSSGSDYSRSTSCDTGGCCGSGSCGLN